MLQQGWPKYPIARILGIGTSAVMPPLARTQEWLIGNSDPTVFPGTGGRKYKLLHFALPHDGGCSAIFYFQSSAIPSEADVRTIAGQLQAATAVKELCLYVRPFHWFAGDPYFDMPYRFYTPFGQTYPSWPLPPNIEQYY